VDLKQKKRILEFDHLNSKNWTELKSRTN